MRAVFWGKGRAVREMWSAGICHRFVEPLARPKTRGVRTACEPAMDTDGEGNLTTKNRTQSGERWHWPIQSGDTAPPSKGHTCC